MPEATTRRLSLALTAVMAALLCLPGIAPGKALNPSKAAPRDFWSPQPERITVKLVQIPGTSRFEFATTTATAPGRPKWLSRDPLGERGGLNLYGFVGNDPVNKVDYLGLDEINIADDGTVYWAIEAIGHIRRLRPLRWITKDKDLFNVSIGKLEGHNIRLDPAVATGALGTGLLVDREALEDLAEDHWFLREYGFGRPGAGEGPGQWDDTRTQVGGLVRALTDLENRGGSGPAVGMGRAEIAAALGRYGFEEERQGVIDGIVHAGDTVDGAARQARRTAVDVGLTALGVPAALRHADEVGLLKHVPDAASFRGAGWFDDLARNATRNPDSDRLVLGHFSRDSTTYQKVAAHYRATYFKVDDWATVTRGLTQDEIWRINKTFLLQQLKQGKQILFSHDPLKARPLSFLPRPQNQWVGSTRMASSFLPIPV